MKLAKYLALAATAPLALLAANPAFADDTAPTAEATATSAGPALWKVADEDTTIYLFGTVHMLPDTVDWNSGIVNEALASADTLVTELNMTPETEAEIGVMFEAKGILPEGQTLRGLMSEDQRAKYEGGLAKIQVPVDTFDTMEPWLASIALLQGWTMAAGFTPDKGVEAVLEKAVAPDVDREALETVEDQLKVFDEMSMEQQVEYLLETAADPMEAINQLNSLVAQWAKGDAEAVGQMMNEALEGHPELAERLLYGRNRNWADWLDARLDAPGTIFVAVGAGHLTGTNSVQDYLAERGIMTSRVQ